MISWCLFWHADKHQSLLQVAINLGVHSQVCPKYPKQICLSLQYLQKKWVVKFLFCLQIKSWFLPAGKQKIVLQVDIIIWYYQYLSNISKKMLRMKLIFCLGINIKSFLKLIPSFLVCVCGQTSAISLQYLTEEVGDEVDSLHALEHEVFLQIHSMVLIGMLKYSQSSQIRKFVMSL